MKYLFVLVALTQTLIKSDPILLRTVSNECLLSTMVPIYVVGNAFQGEIADDPRLGAYISCLFQGMGFINENGEFNYSTLREHMYIFNCTPYITDPQKVVDVCEKKTPSELTKEETAFTVYKCFIESA